ncbi:metallophosphoesterase [Geomonas sp. RF6]|uniref:metallophosphoesterase family protein n=1 Tax=Geomonas sp. RF6 TaxID=2897342 RepID=UPI001E65365C|nr:metallophosphoesterase [Geomonas sp. RF6]UFS69248.1 metallophosphoesterase [Geomonas sp. RF6]
MKILVCSDSHGDYARLFRAHEAAAPVDLTIHLGDGTEDARLLEEVMETPVVRVPGNCDHGSTLPGDILLNLEGVRVFATHGNRYGVKGGLSCLLARGAEVGAGVVLYGHTHIPSIRREGSILLLNPGPLAGLGSYALLTLGGPPPHAELFTLPHPGTGSA